MWALPSVQDSQIQNHYRRMQPSLIRRIRAHHPRIPAHHSPKNTLTPIARTFTTNRPGTPMTTTASPEHQKPLMKRPIPNKTKPHHWYYSTKPLTIHTQIGSDAAETSRHPPTVDYPDKSSVLMVVSSPDKPAADSSHPTVALHCPHRAHSNARNNLYPTG